MMKANGVDQVEKFKRLVSQLVLEKINNTKAQGSVVPVLRGESVTRTSPGLKR